MCLHNKWRHQVTFSEIIGDFSDEMLAVVKNAPKMGTPEFLAMFPYDGAKGLYAEIEENVRTELQGSIDAEQQQDYNERVLEIDRLRSDLDDLRDKAQQADANAAAFESQLANAKKELAAEREKSADLWDSLRRAQEVVTHPEPEAHSLIKRIEEIEMRLSHNVRSSSSTGKEAMPYEPKRNAGPIYKDAKGKGKGTDKDNDRKRGAPALIGSSSGGKSQKKSRASLLIGPASECGLRTRLILTEMQYPNKGEKRNVDIFDAVKQQLGRKLSSEELAMITHHNGPLLGVDAAVYVGSALSKTCRNDIDWYLQFHSFFLGWFSTLRKACDHVSAQYTLPSEYAEFEANMMARFTEINGARKTLMARQLFDLVAKNRFTGIDVTAIRQSLVDHYDAKPGKYLSYDVELLGKETPLVLLAGASSADRTTKKVLASKASDAVGSNGVHFPAQLAKTLMDIEPTESGSGQGAPISRLGSDTSPVFSPSAAGTPRATPGPSRDATPNRQHANSDGDSSDSD